MRVIDAVIAVQSVLSSSGQPGGTEAALGRVFTIIMIAVGLIVTGLLVVGLFRRRPTRDPLEITREGGGTAWILTGGVLIPVIGLGILFALVLTALPGSAQPSKRPIAGTFEIIGHRWWWEIRQVDPAGRTLFVTANELHVPVGAPVRLHLSSADVIHSFWVPQLAGKTDLIPGQVNDAWIMADEPGVFAGYCAEYCGMQHAHMAMRVVAEDSASYQAWLAHEATAAAPATTPAAARGAQVFVSSPCAACHQIRGTPAEGIVGPDLTHVGARQTIGGGMLPNTPGNLAGWIVDAPSVKPGTRMPAIALNGPELQAVLAYLESLK